MGRRWNILVVEDDDVIASVYTRIIASTAPFQVAGVVQRGEDALEWLRVRDADLMLLDLKLAGMNGLTLLHRLRTANNPIEVIVISANRSAKVVHAAVHRGALDYLVKPFPPDRLRQALGLYLHRANAIAAGQLDQERVDQVCGSGRVASPTLPRGLTIEALARVRGVLGDMGELSASDAAERTGLARVTARRYLEYLVARGDAAFDVCIDGPGRPRKFYRLSEAGRNEEVPSGPFR
jgi:response regulator of citrate/malate metabolism